ncbi:MAG: ankyrin repeat domain-containing protein [Phycisphaerae bacterium]|jgi:hypothetical protein|nr:ankyrin repeat domain-containing protein [Phycisphaerae bacterium]
MGCLRIISFALGGMMLWTLGGCVFIIPTVPLNAPGYGHTYHIVDQHDRPIKDGFLMLHSFYRANDRMFRLYPIKDGRAEVPLKIGTRCSEFYWLYLPIWSFRFENPYGTYVYPVVAGHIYAGGWQIAPWDSIDFLDGLSPPPKVLRMRKASPDIEREDLNSMAYPAQIINQPEKDQAARHALKEYVEKRLKQLPPSKSELLNEAIRSKDIQEVRRLLQAGADPNLQQLYSLWRPIYWAVMVGDAEIVELLIEKGAKVNVLNAGDGSPLSMARHEHIRNLLLKHGADPKLGHQPTTQPAR